MKTGQNFLYLAVRRISGEDVYRVARRHGERPSAAYERARALERVARAKARKRVLEGVGGKVARYDKQDKHDEADSVLPLAEYPDERGRDCDSAEKVHLVGHEGHDSVKERGGHAGVN
jgi:hypothetical protein